MAVSKRLRSEIFRRDNSTCHYCGAKAPDVKITIDHVIPVALGGSDEPSNLVTACEDCNNGKTSVPPNAATVARVSEDAVRWASAQKQAVAAMAADFQQVLAKRERFQQEWNDWTWDDGKKTFGLPSGWEDSVDRILQAGLSMELLLECMAVSMRSSSVKVDNKFRYMCGVAWNKVKELRQATAGFVGASVPEAPPTKDHREYSDALYELTLPEMELYGELAKGVRERLGLDSIDEDALAGAIAQAEIEYSGRRIDLIKEYLKSGVVNGERFVEQAYREWLDAYSDTKRDDPEVWEYAAKLALKEEALDQQAWSYFYGLSANEKDSWIRYCRKAFAKEELDERAIQSKAYRVAFDVSHGVMVPAGMCHVAESNAIHLCFNSAAFHTTLTDCPICAEGCSGKHAVCEHHLEAFLSGFRSSSGARLQVRDFKSLEAEE
ncbi:HNH endonuclease [Streptosporangium jomthongense]|uniref:HNH endonuclease n=1 Tax=Streptosporangium jomthongense TaxID=1193683 RepID=A0ABV8FCU7_9ACTN